MLQNMRLICLLFIAGLVQGILGKFWGHVTQNQYQIRGKTNHVMFLCWELQSWWFIEHVMIKESLLHKKY